VLRSAQRADYNTGWADRDAGFQENQAGSVAQFIQYVACHRIGIKPYLLRQTCSEVNI